MQSNNVGMSTHFIHRYIYMFMNGQTIEQILKCTRTNKDHGDSHSKTIVVFSQVKTDFWYCKLSGSYKAQEVILTYTL